MDDNHPIYAVGVVIGITIFVLLIISVVDPDLITEGYYVKGDSYVSDKLEFKDLIQNETALVDSLYLHDLYKPLNNKESSYVTTTYDQYRPEYSSYTNYLGNTLRDESLSHV